jgi:hypothetical protein
LSLVVDGFSFVVSISRRSSGTATRTEELAPRRRTAANVPSATILRTVLTDVLSAWAVSSSVSNGGRLWPRVDPSRGIELAGGAVAAICKQNIASSPVGNKHHTLTMVQVESAPVAQLLPRYRPKESQADREQRIASVVLEAEQAPVGVALLDARELRGWPCAGRGIDGATDHTNPEQALLAKQPD